MDYLLAFLTSCLITFASVPFIIRLAKNLRLVDDPRIRFHPASIHKGIIPRAGGLAIYIGIFVSLLLSIGPNILTLSILVSGAILVAVGLFDDRKDVHPYIRLATNITAALILVLSGISIPYITNPFGGILQLDASWFQISTAWGVYTIYIWSVLFAFLWIFWTINIVGWSAGVDGQMPGFVVISSLVLAVLAYRFTESDPTQKSVVIIAMIVAGAFSGFLPWNFYPQKIMPGYGGKTLAGMLLAVLGILSWGKLGTMLLVLGIPTADALYTLFRRLTSGKSPIWADKQHLHHRLLALGWGKRKIALFYWLMSAILGWIALSVSSTQKVFALLMLGVIFCGMVLWINFFSRSLKQPDQDNG